MKERRRIVLLIVCCVLCAGMLSACGRKSSEDAGKNGKNSDAETTPTRQISLEDYDPEKDNYEYPEGEYGEGFNYGTVRGRWRATAVCPYAELNDAAKKAAQEYENLFQAINVELPDIEFGITMRFIDPTHVEGSVSSDFRVLMNVLLDTCATEDGLKKMYAAMYGLTKNEVAYAFYNAGISLQELAEEIRALLTPEGGVESMNMTVPFSDTYTMKDNKIIFDNLDICLEYDEANDTFKAYIGAQDEIAALNYLDGAILEKR